jgi:hypothetical protein
MRRCDVTVLTNADGFTLYWFASDTATQVHLLRNLRRLLAAGDRPLWPARASPAN